MSERRTLLSRPRTRVYDCNYNIGEKYYKPMVDQLDKKYSGSSFSSAPHFIPSTTFSSRLKEEDDFPPPRRPFSGGNGEFESLSERRSRLNSETRSLEDDLEEDIINSMKRLKAIRAAKAASVDEDFPTVNGSLLNGTHKEKRLNLTNKILDSVGINSKTQGNLEEEILKKRTVKIPSMFDDESAGLTKWSALRDSAFDDTAELSAMARARQSRARLADIESEMDAVAERGAARDKRISNIRALISGEDAFADVSDSFKSKKISSRSSSSKKVSF